MAAASSYFDVNTSQYHLNIASSSEFIRFLTSTAIVLLTFYFVLFLIIDTTPLLSFISFTVVGIIPVLLYTRLLIGNHDNKTILLVAFAYALKSFMGIVFYILFVDPNYFSDGTSVATTSVDDFTSMYATIINYSKTFDFTYSSIIDNAGGARHIELYALLSVPFKFSGGYYLTIAPMNVIFSSLTAIIIAYITKLRNGKYPLALLLALFYPLSLTSSYFFRDLLGMLIASFAIALIELSGKMRLFSLALASYLFYLQRTPYVAVPIAAYILYVVLQSKGKKMRFFSIIVVLSAILLLLAASSFLGSIYEEGNYTEAHTNILTYVLFPVRYFITIIGPFPWTQIFDPVPEKKFYWQDFVMSSALFLITFKYFPYLWKKIKKKETIDYLTVVAFLIMFMGIMTTPPHIGYIGWGLCFFLPNFVNTITIKEIAYFTIRYLLFMLIFNIIYVSLGSGGVMKAIFS